MAFIWFQTTTQNALYRVKFVALGKPHLSLNKNYKSYVNNYLVNISAIISISKSASSFICSSFVRLLIFYTLMI